MARWRPKEGDWRYADREPRYMTGKQAATIRGMCERLGRTIPNMAGWSRTDASSFIRELKAGK